MAYDLIFKNGTAVLPGLTTQADIGVKDGVIAAIGALGSEAPNIIDCKNLHILPGVIDTQVHFREPGMEHKETLASGMKAAALGGVTSIFEMPNTKPLTTTPEALADKMARASREAWVDYAFYFGGTAQNAKQLREWQYLPGVCGIKIFMGSSTGDLLVAQDDHIEDIFRHITRVLAVHAEDEAMMIANKKNILGDQTDVALHPVWRSVESCLNATKRVVRLAQKTGRRVHVLHITSADEMDFLRAHKDYATAEVLPNHLTLYAPDCYQTLGTHAQQNPPIREKHHQDALWRAIEDGTVDIIGSDHAPHTRDEKAGVYPATPSGTPGVQTLVPIMLNHVHNGRLSLERFVDLVCEGPHRVHQIAKKGRITNGFDADLTIVDLKAQRTISNADQASKSNWSPFDGMRVTGWPMMTVLRGNIIMRDGALVGSPKGQPVLFRENLPAAT